MQTPQQVGHGPDHHPRSRPIRGNIRSGDKRVKGVEYLLVGGEFVETRPQHAAEIVFGIALKKDRIDNDPRIPGATQNLLEVQVSINGQ